MKPFSMNFRKVMVAVCGCGLAAGLLAYRAQADQWDKMTTLTINQKIQVRDRVLDPGTYVFRLEDSQSDRHVVQIFNSDRTHIIDTILAIPNYRLRPTGKSQFMFWETPPGAAPALRAWFYPGDNFGQEFPYPKHLAMLQVAQKAPEPAPQVAQAAPAPAPEPQAERQAEPAPAPEPAPTPAPEPQQMAQATPPPAPAEPAPAQLPHTASPFATVGLGGMLAIALYGLIRLKRLA